MGFCGSFSWSNVLTQIASPDQRRQQRRPAPPHAASSFLGGGWGRNRPSQSASWPLLVNHDVGRVFHGDAADDEHVRQHHGQGRQRQGRAMNRHAPPRTPPGPAKLHSQQHQPGAPTISAPSGRVR